MTRRLVLCAVGAAVMTLVACGNPLQENDEGDRPGELDEPTGPGFAVQYHANGADSGRAPADDYQYSAGASVLLSPNYGGLERENWTFDGWNSEPDGTGDQYYIGESFAMPEHDLALYAQWSDEPQCYAINAATGTVTRYLCSTAEEQIVIPATIEGAIVRRIGRSLFNSRSLTSVDLPDTVVEIGQYAFNNNDLTHIGMPRDLEIVRAYAFASNEDLASIQLGPSLREVHHNAFWKANPSEIILPDGIEYIGSSAFSNTLGLGPASVEVPGSLTVIGTGAFANNRIATLILHEGVEVLLNGAFFDNELTSVDLPDSVVSVDRSVFFLNAITEVTIGSDVEIYDGTSFGDYGESFRAHYIGNGQESGTYGFDGAEWNLE